MSEVEIAPLLALSGASFLTSRPRFLALSVLVLSLAASIALPNSADDVRLLAQSALALTSRLRTLGAPLGAEAA